MRKYPLVTGVAAIAAVTGLVLPAASTAAAPTAPGAGTVPLVERVSAAGVTEHLQKLQQIAKENGGNRALGEPGYRASLNYVKSQLDAAGYVTHVQEFTAEGVTTYNLIAETSGGDPNNVVMLGAHLDSVRSGPGINDNGSGTAAILEAALAYADGGTQPTNKLRFAFWGAEEQGLLGSRHYVGSLSQSERDKIALYLNFDMVGSPNAGYFTYDGDDSDGVGAGPGPEGSGKIEKMLNEAFAQAGVRTEGTDFTGRSDYGPFIKVGIPAGGSFTGAEGIKTDAQARKWGGQAGKAYDPCYHRACDTVDNINQKALDINADVIAQAVETYAKQTPLP